MKSAKGFCTKEGVGTLFDGVLVVEGQRTPFGKYTGALSTVTPTDLGIVASRAVIKKSGVEASEIDQVIVSNIGQGSADAFFLPRHIGLYAGAPLEAPASLVQRICGSGIEVIGQAAEQIALGKAQLVLGCGTDTMSRFPLVSFGARQGFQLGKPEFVDLLWEALNDTAAVPMGMTADNVAKKYALKREEVDAFANRSQERYQAAKAKNFFADEITPVENLVIEAGNFHKRKLKLNRVEKLTDDEHPRQTSLDQLAKLPFVFSKEGPTTAGSASGIVDGACAVLIASDEYVQKRKLKPIGRVLGVCASGLDPNVMGLGPVPAIKCLLGQLKLNMGQIDLFEINEAFGAQCLGVARALELDENKLNVHGGAIAIGHPLGATGQRLVTTLLKGLRARGGKLGVASACIGGGQGIAMVVEAL
ncbi:MAG: thiolase family protein [Bdellovibrionales bacterium]|nr:thiolase family protein [Bdellovibrionales bacterium]